MPKSCPRCHRYFETLVDWTISMQELANNSMDFLNFVERALEQKRVPKFAEEAVSTLVVAWQGREVGSIGQATQ